MNKMKMAHDMALELVKIKPSLSAWQIADRCFEYADAMQAEADKRNKAEAEQKRKEVREILSDANTFIEREGQHFDDVADIQKPYTSSEALCEVDWSQAPNDAIGWMIFDGVSTCLGADDHLIDDAPSFGFTGSHTVERPQ